MTFSGRKLVQINKSANVDFINMESGGVRPAPARPANGPGAVNTVPGSPTPAPAKAPAPKTPEPAAPQSPKSPVPTAPQSSKTPVVTPIVQELPTQSKPQPNQPDLKPVSKPASGPSGGVTTPGYGKVKDLVTFYDSQGKASPIRPYSYSQAVKQG